ncbi:hypothetical protein LEP1GSC198_3298 [Leptospira kirschneri str. JB]|nr:hypothetical protein [Leptospira kirschneri]EMJ94031.1 hypothetical protein LEP1GSC198_3298 [Leptospira kirschneri str. JB]
MNSSVTLSALIDFNYDLQIDGDVLGSFTEITIGDQKGVLKVPVFNYSELDIKEPLSKPLKGPQNAENWKRDKKALFWGRPISYPTIKAIVNSMLIEFSSIELTKYDEVAQKIYDHYNDWHDLFNMYITLFTRQDLRSKYYQPPSPTSFAIFRSDEKELVRITHVNSKDNTISYAEKGKYLSIEDLKKICHLTSNNINPLMEWKLFLKALDAQRKSNNRMAIIEAANALEFCLTSRIMEEFKNQSINFGEKLLQKFRMLGGRFELLRILSIPIPEKNYESLIIKPRNDVVHRAEFPEDSLVDQVICEVEKILLFYYPDFHN